MSLVVMVSEYDPNDGDEAIVSTRGWNASPDQVDLIVALLGEPVVETVNNVEVVRRATAPFITFLSGGAP